MAITVRNGRGKVVKRLQLGSRPVNTALTAAFRCTLRPGTYRFSVRATDAAGNPQANIAAADGAGSGAACGAAYRREARGAGESRPLGRWRRRSRGGEGSGSRPRRASASIASVSAPSARSIRPCAGADFDAMCAVINAAATAYAGVIPADRYHVPYMPADELLCEIAAGVRFLGFGMTRRASAG